MDPLSKRSVAFWTIVGSIAAVIGVILAVGSGTGGDGGGGTDGPNPSPVDSGVTLEDWAADVNQLCKDMDAEAFTALFDAMENAVPEADKVAAAQRVEAAQGQFVEQLQNVPLPTRSGPREAASEIRAQAVDAANGIAEFADYGIPAGEAGDSTTANEIWQKFSRNFNDSRGELTGLGARACEQTWQ